MWRPPRTTPFPYATLFRSTQRVGEAVDAKAARETGDLCRVTDRGHVTDLLPAHANRAAAGQQDPVTRQQHLILVLEPAGQEPQETSLRQHLRKLAPDAVGRQAEQAAALVVDERDDAAPVGCDRALVNALEARLPLLEESRDLERLEAERLPLEARREEHRADDAQTERKQNRKRKTWQLGQQLREDGRLEKAHRNHADHT